MVAAITEAVLAAGTRDWWPQWRAVRCPTLLVIGEKGIVPPEESIQMLDAAHAADPSTVTTAVSVPGAGHDVHLDRPAVVHSLLSAFLTEFRTEPGPGVRHVRHLGHDYRAAATTATTATGHEYRDRRDLRQPQVEQYDHIAV